MNPPDEPVRDVSLATRPAAWLPVSMSLATIALIGVTFVRGRLVPQPDEGAEAHLFQILMAGQVPIVGWFAMRWLPDAPAAAMRVLAVQILAALAAMAPVWYLHL